MRVAVVGSREFINLGLVIEFVTGLPENAVYISGGARGVDQTGEIAADHRKLSKVIHKPVWHRPDGSYDVGAGMKRNDVIINDADVVVVFWNGTSKGSRDDINKAKKAGKLLRVFGENSTYTEVRELAESLK